MSHPVIVAMRAEGRLSGLMGRAVLEGLEPLLGVGTTVIGEVPLPWTRPPAALALVPLTEGTATGFRGMVWFGGEIADLAMVAAALLGQEPGGDDEALQDCVRELTNILAGRVQEQLRAEGPATSLGLPLYLSGASTLAIGSSPSDGVAVRIRIDLPDGPEVLTGLITGAM